MERPGAFVANLPGHRRVWGVAMDNSRDIPGYKYFIDQTTGKRPAVFVAFLDLAPDPATAVNGRVFETTTEELHAIDERERNYERREVRVEGVTGAVYAYFGTAAARERFATGPTVVSREYLAHVRAGFERLGTDQLARFDASTDRPTVPIRELRRVEIPPIRVTKTGESAG